MGRRRSSRPPTREEIAAAIEEVAERVAQANYSFEVQLPILTAQEGLLKLKDLEGMRLPNRVSLLLLSDNGASDMKYDFVQKTVESLPRLDPAEDSAALRSLASRVRVEV